MRIAVTGGAGYIGSHAVDALLMRGDEVIVVDDLSTGAVERIGDAELVELDLASDTAGAELGRVLSDRRVDAVMHFAALKRVDESIERPGLYYRVNLASTLAVIDAMRNARVPSLVLSSSAAVYGEVDGIVDESCATRPLNPYGATKLACETLVDAAARSGALRAASLRYFNVAGASRPELGDHTIVNLIAIVIDQLSRGETPLVFGGDYGTPDGSCVRDFVHVADVASAHVAVLDLLETTSGHKALNVGTGRGTSVLEIIDIIASAMGSDIKPVMRPRRAGDPANVVANVDEIKRLTGWSAAHELEETVRSSLEAHRWRSA